VAEQRSGAGCACAFCLVLAALMLYCANAGVHEILSRLQRIEQKLELSEPGTLPALPWLWDDWRRQLFERDGLDPEK